MGQMEDLRLFVQVVENGSISKAAGKLNIAKSAVSRRLALLEDRYAARLIDREPGTWAVTDAGRELFQRTIGIVQELDELEGDFLTTSGIIDGPLTVSVPREFGSAYIYPSLIEFKARYPKIRLTINFDDRRVDLNRENVDLAIRIARQPDDGLESIKIGTVRHALHASAAYLAGTPSIGELSDLHHHQLLYFGAARRASWEFVGPAGKMESFEFPPFLNSNSGLFLLNAVRKGLGIARLPRFITSGDEAAGELVQVLPDVSIPDWGIYIVYAGGRRLNRRMRLFIDDMKRVCPIYLDD